MGAALSVTVTVSGTVSVTQTGILTGAREAYRSELLAHLYTMAIVVCS